MRAAAGRGFTVVELLIATSLSAIVGTAIAMAIATQWRSHDALADRARTRQALGDAADVLLAELRAVSPAGGDLVAVEDTAIEVRATIGAAVICSVSVARDRVTLPPRRPVVGAALTWWRDAPAAGDSVAILDGRAGLPDTVSRHELVSIGSASCPLSSGFVYSAPDAASGIALTLSPPLPPSIGAGAPLRFLRRARYSVYRSSADGRWYFGIKELLGGAWSGVQPVAGPLAPASAAGTGGMRFVARGRGGSNLTGPVYGAATELEITMRANGLRPARALGRSAPVAESLRVSLAPRN